MAVVKQTTPVTKNIAELIEYRVTSTIAWTDDSKVYGETENWSVPYKTDKNGIKLDDCDGYMSDAMDIVRNFPRNIPDKLLNKYGVSKDINIKLSDVVLAFVKVEKPEHSSNTDGTEGRGGHAILLLLNESKDDAYIIDNRSLRFLTDGMALTQKECDYLNSHTFPHWISPDANPFNKQYVEPYVRTVKELADKGDGKGYLFLAGKCLGADDECQDWTIYNHPDWQWLYEIIKQSQAIDKRETGH